MGEDETKTTISNGASELERMFRPLTPNTPDRRPPATATESPSGNSDDGVPANIHASPGSMSHMMGLFAPPLAPTSPSKNTRMGLFAPPLAPTSPSKNTRMGLFAPPLAPTSPAKNAKRSLPESVPLLGGYGTLTPIYSREAVTSSSTVDDLEKTPIATVRPSYGGVGSSNPKIDDNAQNSGLGQNNGHVRRNSVANHKRNASVVMPPISESSSKINGQPSHLNAAEQVPESCFSFSNVVSALRIPTTYIGSFVYLLYHVVFCLALASAIMRPNSSVSILGLMTKTAALGTLAAAPVYWMRLSQEVPALYPTADLFLAPFLAKLAAIVDQTLADDASVTDEENDAVFLASFGVLTAVGTATSACLILAAGVFQLANMGSYLPFPVICGFFSAVGILTWTLAINVDTGGHTIGAILTSYDGELVRYALLHHVPTIVVAGFMKYLGPKNPFFVCLVVVVTIALFYVFMFVTGTSLEEMKEEGWFWSHDELVYENYSSTLGFDIWAPPAPCGVMVVIHQVHWGAVKNGFSTAIAMSFLYLIRCSVHGAALKKNVSNLSRRVLRGNPPEPEEMNGDDDKQSKTGIVAWHLRKFSEAVDIEAVMSPPIAQGSGSDNNNPNTKEDSPKYEIITAKPTNVNLKTISLTYGLSQVVTAFVGGFAITPSVAAAPTMFMLGADGLAPQIGSVLLLFLFYLSDFRIVGYIPKPAFSSMLVLSFMDMITTWFYKSFFKTKDKMEWIVVPIIVFCAFALDLLSAVFLGIAFSTFIFVGAFFRSGVVKYAANGQHINSTIERPFRMSEWLNENGDRIQVLCLQNYLFFGNASSIYSYVFALFESNKEMERSFLKPESKFLILDLTLVTGMDTSTVDVFSEIRNLCGGSNCKLFMAGMSTNIRSILALGNFKPEAGVRSKRQLRFFASLDAALGKAEDILLESDYDAPQTDPGLSRPGMRRFMRRNVSGFQTALRHIDTECGDNYSRRLEGLEKYTTMIELQSGEALYDDEKSETMERGLFFIEVGILKVERDTGNGNTATRRGCVFKSGSSSSLGQLAGEPMTGIHDLSLTGKLDENPAASESQTFRLARLGVGWVAGTMEFFQKRPRPGKEVALDYCKLHYLPFSKIQEVEAEDPGLLLELYKLLSYLMAQRQEATIGQLATLHSIMSSPAR